MKYFTPELTKRLQDFSSDAAMDRADAAWDKAAQRYRRHLKRILPELPRGCRFLLENFYLHDADVLSMGQRGQTFLVTLRLDVPPKELLILNYHLIEQAAINMAALDPKSEGGPVQWMYDEVDFVRGKKQGCTHSILLSNGWVVDLRLGDVRVVRAQTLYPVPGTALVPVASSAISQPA